jgi:hypothetical protein
MSEYSYGKSAQRSVFLMPSNIYSPVKLQNCYVRAEFRAYKAKFLKLCLAVRRLLKREEQDEPTFEDDRWVVESIYVCLT